MAVSQSVKLDRGCPWGRERLTYRHRDPGEFSLLQSWPDTGDVIAQQDADDDCQQNPKDQQPIEPSEPSVNRLLGCRTRGLGNLPLEICRRLFEPGTLVRAVIMGGMWIVDGGRVWHFRPIGGKVGRMA